MTALTAMISIAANDLDRESVQCYSGAYRFAAYMDRVIHQNLESDKKDAYIMFSNIFIRSRFLYIGSMTLWIEVQQAMRTVQDAFFTSRDFKRIFLCQASSNR